MGDFLDAQGGYILDDEEKTKIAAAKGEEYIPPEPEPDPEEVEQIDLAARLSDLEKSSKADREALEKKLAAAEAAVQEREDMAAFQAAAVPAAEEEEWDFDLGDDADAKVVKAFGEMKSHLEKREASFSNRFDQQERQLVAMREQAQIQHAQQFQKGFRDATKRLLQKSDVFGKWGSDFRSSLIPSIQEAVSSNPVATVDNWQDHVRTIIKEKEDAWLKTQRPVNAENVAGKVNPSRKAPPPPPPSRGGGSLPPGKNPEHPERKFDHNSAADREAQFMAWCVEEGVK